MHHCRLYHLLEISFFPFFLGRPPRPRIVLIIGWWSPNTITAATRFLDSVPFLLRIMCYFFLSSNDGSGPPLSPSEIHPGSLPTRAICPRILSFSSYFLLSVCLSFSLPYTSISAGCHPLSSHMKSTAFQLTADR